MKVEEKNNKVYVNGYDVEKLIKANESAIDYIKNNKQTSTVYNGEGFEVWGEAVESDELLQILESVKK